MHPTFPLPSTRAPSAAPAPVLRLVARLALGLVVGLGLGACAPAPYWGPAVAPAPDPGASLKAPAADWYKDQVFYHIWVPAFADSNGDGLGDLPGITAHLPYLQDLGVTALWLSPFWVSPSSHGYDVADYSRVDPRYGTNDDLRALLKAAHALGFRVIFDLVPNHVSAQNPWFTDSRDGKNDRRRWFLWRDRAPASGWLDFGRRSAWRPAGGSFYYALFWDQMPDLNYREPGVRQAMAGVITRWLDFGFDGMRVDAVKYLFEDEATGANADQPETFEFFRRVRADLLAPYAALGYPKFMVGENWTNDVDNLNRYLSTDGRTNDGLQATLDFPFGTTVGRLASGLGDPAADLEKEAGSLIRRAEAEGGWTFTFLSNHDNYQSRPGTLFSDPRQAALAEVFQMTLWGTPVLYYGNEVGMPGASGNDQNMRRPFPWAQVPRLRADPQSLWNLQANLDRLRLRHPALRRGEVTFLPTQGAVSAWVRTLGTDRVLVVVNRSDGPVDAVVDLGGGLTKTFRGLRAWGWAVDETGGAAP